MSRWPHWSAVLAPVRGKLQSGGSQSSGSPSYFSAFLWTGRKQSAMGRKMPDGDHVRFLLSFLSASPLVPQSEDGQGREAIEQPLCRRHCAADFIVNHY